MLAPGELLDDHDEPCAAVDDRVADQRLVVDRDRRRRRSAAAAAGALDGHLAELRRVGELLEDVAHLQPLLRGLDEAAGAGGRGLEEAQRRHDLRVAGGPDHLAEGDVLRRRSCSGSTCTWSCWSRMPPDRHVRDARDAHQPRAARSSGR